MEIGKGIYLVIDPSMDERILLEKLDTLVGSPIAAVQLWDNFPAESAIEPLVRHVCERCSPAGIPVIINNRWEYLRHTPLDGVHFDGIPPDFAAIGKAISRPFRSGLTCNNDLSLVRWAATHGLDYISFCSMFPSPTANSCELVEPGTVREARRLFGSRIFLAGGIRPQNLHQLAGLGHDGIAIVSGIMHAEEPKRALDHYYEELAKNHEN